MSRAILNGLENLKKWIIRNPSRVETIVRATGELGKRAAPAQIGKNDAEIGVRIDNGGVFQREGKFYKRFNLQLNVNAANTSIKKIARQNPDKKWASVELEVPQDDAETGAIDKKKGGAEEERKAAKQAREAVNMQALEGLIEGMREKLEKM